MNTTGNVIASVMSRQASRTVADLWQCDYERLNPPTESLEVDNEYYECITPRNRAAWFLYHVVHGLAMGYPVVKVLLYAVCNTRPGDEA